jgi:hypothetical protein
MPETALRHRRDAIKYDAYLSDDPDEDWSSRSVPPR